MSDPTEPFSDGLREYYASAQPGVAALDTIELRHSAFVASDGVTPIALRFVNDPGDLIATLEADAPMNPGAAVTFTRSAFAATIPEQSSPGLPTMGLEVVNVSGILIPYLDEAAASNEAIQVTYRQYRSDSTTAPGFVIGGLTLQSVNAGLLRITGQVGCEDFLNSPHPAKIYTQREFPNLVSGQ